MGVLALRTPGFSGLLAPSSRLLAVIVALTADCTAGKDQGRASTQRERDSVIGASKLPGAGGVRGALRAADSAAARNARIDSAGTDAW